MQDNLTLTFWPAPAGLTAPLKAIEQDVTREFQPPLNLTHVPEPWAELRLARKVMANQARAKQSERAMPRRVLVQRSDESFDLIETPAPNEHHLQEVMKSHPQLIPADDLGLDGDLLVIGRETSLASGLIDLLLLSRSGELVLVEFKTGPQNPDLRHALAQVIDYGSDLWRLSLDDFDRGVVQPYLISNRSDVPPGVRDLDAAIATSGWSLGDEELAALRERVQEVLQTGDFIYVVAAQRFTEPMKVSLEYLNTMMRFGRFYLVEMVLLSGKDLTAHTAQVVASPPRRTGAGGGSSPETQTSETEFLATLPDDVSREAIHDFLARCEALGLVTTWRSKGASLKLSTPDRAVPLSVGWLLPPASHWQGARNLTLGFDPGSLAQTPSVADAVRTYAAAVALIPGAQPTKSGLEAYIFEPAAVHEHLPQLIAAVEGLVAQVRG